MNKFLAIGRLTKDPELTTTQGGLSVCKFTLAVNRKYSSGEQKADFINCVAWRGLADNINKFCRKGGQVYIEGELQTRNYQAADGTKKYITEINVNDCQFLSKPDGQSTPSQKQSKQSSIDDLQPDDGDLPF